MEYLKKLRKLIGFSQKVLSEKIGMDQASYSQLESLKAKPNMRKQNAIDAKLKQALKPFADAKIIELNEQIKEIENQIKFLKDYSTVENDGVSEIIGQLCKHRD